MLLRKRSGNSLARGDHVDDLRGCWLVAESEEVGWVQALSRRGLFLVLLFFVWGGVGTSRLAIVWLHESVISQGRPCRNHQRSISDWASVKSPTNRQPKESGANGKVQQHSGHFADFSQSLLAKARLPRRNCQRCLSLRSERTRFDVDVW